MKSNCWMAISAENPSLFSMGKTRYFTAENVLKYCPFSGSCYVFRCWYIFGHWEDKLPPLLGQLTHITGFKFLYIYKATCLVLITNFIGNNTNNLYEINSPNVDPLKDWKRSIIHPWLKWWKHQGYIGIYAEGIIYFSQGVKKDDFHTHKSFPLCVFWVQSALFGVVPCKLNLYN